MTSSESEGHVPAPSRKRARRSDSADKGPEKGRKARGRPRVATTDATAADVSRLGCSLHGCGRDGESFRPASRRGNPANTSDSDDAHRYALLNGLTASGKRRRSPRCSDRMRSYIRL